MQSVIIKAKGMKYLKTKIFQNKKSVSEGIGSLEVKSAVYCTGHCADTNGCLAVNYNNGTCELLKETTGAHNLVSENGWKYIGRCFFHYVIKLIKHHKLY